MNPTGRVRAEDLADPQERITVGMQALIEIRNHTAACDERYEHIAETQNQTKETIADVRRESKEQHDVVMESLAGQTRMIIGALASGFVLVLTAAAVLSFYVMTKGH